MTGPLLFDTNLFIYAMDPKNPTQRGISMNLIGRAWTDGRLVMSPQILNECYRVLVHKRKLVVTAVADRYRSAFHGACTAPLDLRTHQDAIQIETKYRLSWWDCVAVASALQANCTHFVSKDLNDGQVIESLTVVNPFASHARATLALT